ncbi:hypothetical protein Q5H92_18040 [Hymenobacter sp. M29]|uniref:Uncharacterized protein n=1 Tax=Hymenobacter mellowenesis TaxID=3063995 RepID=A0ABT9AEI7_9BACT|nr:hypothetical protein [Hymenobacter sp. M29]MDO7848273.1 hypothetical protein [Hymenobacter sp. M29]
MFGKNIFRTFLYFVVAIVLLKLCYNLGYGLVNRRMAPATGAVPAKTAPADSAAAAPTTAAPQ